MRGRLWSCRFRRGSNRNGFRRRNDAGKCLNRPRLDDREAQRKVIKYNHLATSCIVFHNFAPEAAFDQMTQEGSEINVEALETFLSSNLQVLLACEMRILLTPDVNLAAMRTLHLTSFY
jgi:hypothetical protein